MTKKLYLPLLVALVAVLTSCSSKMGELSSDYFTVTPQVLEAVGGKVPLQLTVNSLKSISRKSRSRSYSGFEMGRRRS